MAEGSKKDKLVEKEKDKTCFVIMPFSDPDGYEPGHFKEVYETIFAPAIEKAGYVPFRTDLDFASASILGKIVTGLTTAPMVLCDLSSRNPNVLYELGIRQAFELPVVLVHEKESKPIFDVSDIATIEYSPTMKYADVLQDRENIEKAIIATASGNESSSIIRLAKIAKARMSGLENTSTEQSELTLASILKDLDFIKSFLLNKTKEDMGNSSDIEIMYYLAECDINEFINILTEIKSDKIKQLDAFPDLEKRLETINSYITNIKNRDNRLKIAAQHAHCLNELTMMKLINRFPD